jgi:hypothetical protein
MHMSFLAKAPLSLARATISSLATPLEPAAGPGKMASNNRQNVTWVEVCSYDMVRQTSTNMYRVFAESLPSGSS